MVNGVDRLFAAGVILLMSGEGSVATLGAGDIVIVGSPVVVGTALLSESTGMWAIRVAVTRFGG